MNSRQAPGCSTVRLLMAACLLTAVVLAGAPASAAGSAAPAGDGYDGHDGSGHGRVELDNHGAGRVHLLTPGEVSRWLVDARVTGDTAAVTTRIRSDGRVASAPLRAAMTVAVDGCSEPWNGRRCPAVTRAVMVPTPLDDTDMPVPLPLAAGAEGDEVYLLIRVRLDERAERTLQGSHARLELVVTAAGTGGKDAGKDAGSVGGGLANTGADIGWSLALGVAAVGVGAALARWGSRLHRFRRHEHRGRL